MTPYTDAAGELTRAGWLLALKWRGLIPWVMRRWYPHLLKIGTGRFDPWEWCWHLLTQAAGTFDPAKAKPRTFFVRHLRWACHNYPKAAGRWHKAEARHARGRFRDLGWSGDRRDRKAGVMEPIDPARGPEPGLILDVRAAVAKLPPTEYRAVTAYLDCGTMDAAGARLGVSGQYVQQTVRSAKVRLRRMLAAYSPEG